jgi:hypothetical protein
MEISSRSSTDTLLFGSDHLPGHRAIEVPVNDKPFKMIEFDVVE